MAELDAATSRVLSDISDQIGLNVDHTDVHAMSTDDFSLHVMSLLRSGQVKGTDKEKGIMLFYAGPGLCSGKTFLAMSQDDLAAAMYSECRGLGGYDMPACISASQALRSAVASHRMVTA